MKALAWDGLQLTSLQDARIPLKDRGFQVGHGVFETMRTRRGQIWNLEAHMDRLRRGAEFLNLSLDQGRMDRCLERLLSTIPAWATDGRLRMMATGTGDGFADGGAKARITATWESIPKPRRSLAAIQLVSGPFHHHSQDPTHQHKVLGYSQNVALHRFALRQEADAGLFLDEHGHYLETSTGSLLVRTSKEWICPGTESGALAGTTRNHLAGRHPLVDRPVTKEDLHDALEAWVLSSVAGPRAVRSIDGIEIPVDPDQNLRKQFVDDLDAWRQPA